MTKQRKFKEVDSSFAKPWNPETEGEILEGIYIGYDDVPTGRRSHSDKSTFRSYRIKTDEINEEGNNIIMGVAGAFLDSKIKRVPKGSYVQIVYKGTTKTANGTAKDFIVNVEEEVRLLDSLDDEVF